jgi:protoheme ferro-lyase
MSKEKKQYYTKINLSKELLEHDNSELIAEVARKYGEKLAEIENYIYEHYGINNTSIELVKMLRTLIK